MGTPKVMLKPGLSSVQEEIRRTAAEHPIHSVAWHNLAQLSGLRSPYGTTMVRGPTLWLLTSYDSGDHPAKFSR